MKVTRRLRIYGRVQGVGFRELMCQQADQLKVTGWVRNRSDGTVEAMTQGDSSAVEVLVEWARRGPEGARVDRVQVESADGETNFGLFDKKPTI